MYYCVPAYDLFYYLTVVGSGLFSCLTKNQKVEVTFDFSCYEGLDSFNNLNILLPWLLSRDLCLIRGSSHHLQCLIAADDFACIHQHQL